MRDVVQAAGAAQEARETLEPMLDDLMRGLRYERAIVLAHDEASGALRGMFGLNAREDLVRTLSVPIGDHAHPFVVALRTGAPQRVETAGDPRIGPAMRAALDELGARRVVATALPSLGDAGSAAVILLAREERIRDADLDRLVPFARQAGAALTREHDVEVLRRTTESHAVEKEWLWWMLNAVSDPVLVADARNDILHLNTRAEHLFRSGDQDSAGRRRAVWMNNFLFTAALSGWSLDRGHPPAGREVTLVDPIDGNELIFEVITTPATNHRTGERGTVSLLKNVTDIRHMTEELERSAVRIQTADEQIRAERDRLDLVLRSVPNPIIVVDNENHIISTNAAAQRLFAASAGRPAQHAMNNNARFTSFLAELRLEPGPRRSELGLTDPQTGERLEMEVTATEVRDPHGGVVAIVSAMQEVGRLRELERRRLERVLFETEKLAATGRLAASIAHEINNPLEAVQNAIYLLGTAVPASAPQRQFLEVARGETQRMSRILRQMLGFYRPGSDMAPVDLNVVVEEAEALVAKRLRDTRVVVTRDLDRALPPIRASADQLKQVLLNLFLNAGEAMPGGGTLSIRTRAGASAGEVPSDTVRLEVGDTGVGMDEDTQARIFEPFFSTKTQRGTGLGLWVSHGIVQGHGGTLKVRSTPGAGTTFVVTLPVQGPPADG